MSGLTLTVDAAAWRQHQQTVADATPGLVPVAKGNGYGFGLPRLAEEAELLGADTIAVGVPDEVSAVRERFSGDIVVLNPWRDGDPGSARTVEDERVIPTVSRADDLAALGAGGTPTRVLVEVMTSMRRHGIASGDLRMVADLADHLDFDGWVIHLPHAETGRVREAEALAAACQAARPGPIWFSHLAAADARRITEALGVDVRMRVGTQLWLGAPGSRRATATVLDVHRVERGDAIGYWQRKSPTSGWVVIVAGGTANGIAMEAPTSARNLRSRAISFATGSLEALGRALSPYTIDGSKRWFAEPPHMQSSMVLLPGSATPPAIGDEVEVELRLTTANVDRIDLNEVSS